MVQSSKQRLKRYSEAFKRQVMRNTNKEPA